MKLSRQRFEEIVAEALDELPDEIGEALSNVYVVVEQWPSVETLREMNMRSRHELLALYQGIPLTKRNTNYGGAVLPDRITIFQGPIQAMCDSLPELIVEIKRAVVHEMAHHFGIGEQRLRELGY
jgi:predicted Zn-dependent protease with MMP-like domain